MIFYENKYEGNPLAKHMSLPVNSAHFDRWLALFHSTQDGHFAGPAVIRAKAQSMGIAAVFMSKLGLRDSLNGVGPVTD